MKAIEFCGTSDDLFEVNGFLSEEFDCTYESVHDKPVRLLVCKTDHSEGLYVVGHYAAAPGGCWAVGVQQLDEDVPLPDRWRLSLDWQGYTVILRIAIPDDVAIEIMQIPHKGQER